MGSTFRLPIWTDNEFDEALEWANDNRLITTATGTSSAKHYTAIDWRKPRLLVFGSEAHGLTRSQMAPLNEIVTIPMENRVESLNLGVSAGVILFEAKRQNDIWRAGGSIVTAG